VRSIGKLASRVQDRAPIPLSPTRRSAGFNMGRDAAPYGKAEQLNVMGGVGILFSIVNRTSTAAASTVWKLYRKPRDNAILQHSGTSGQDERDEITTHAALQLWQKPNDFYTGQRFVESFQQHVDLTGEGYWIIGRDPRVSFPTEMWCVRPDRIAPVPDPDTFLKGYVYLSPDGERIPLRLDEVVPIIVPDPRDPYRGMGAVQTIMADLQASQFTSQYNRNFFLNSAEPGGVIEVEKRLTDDEFDELAMRWNEQHRGVSKAHRIAVLEQGHYVPMGWSMKDMAFPELRQANREAIMEAFGISNSTLGITDGVNFAAAKAAKAQFAELLTVPRLERIKQALNNNFLPLFGSTGKGVEFDYVSPVPQDPIEVNAERDSKFAALGVALPLGFDAEALLSALGLPPIKWTKPEVPVQGAPVGNPDSTADQEELAPNGAARR
jgi:HK97 family phage portal protein